MESTSTYVFETDSDQNGDVPTILFTENDTNYEKTENSEKKNESKYVKDAFHKYVIQGTVNPFYNDIRYNSKIRYNVNSVSTKVSGSCSFSLTVPSCSLGKHTF